MSEVNLSRREKLELFKLKKKAVDSSKNVSNSAKIIEKPQQSENINPNTTSATSALSKQLKQISLKTKPNNSNITSTINIPVPVNPICNEVLQAKLTEAKSIMDLCGIIVTRTFLEALCISYSDIIHHSLFWITWVKLEENSGCIHESINLIQRALLHVTDTPGRMTLTALQESLSSTSFTSPKQPTHAPAPAVCTPRNKPSATKGGASKNQPSSYNLRSRNTPASALKRASTPSHCTDRLESLLGYNSDDTDTDYIAQPVIRKKHAVNPLATTTISSDNHITKQFKAITTISASPRSSLSSESTRGTRLSNKRTLDSLITTTEEDRNPSVTVDTTIDDVVPKKSLSTHKKRRVKFCVDENLVTILPLSSYSASTTSHSDSTGTVQQYSTDSKTTPKKKRSCGSAVPVGRRKGTPYKADGPAFQRAA